MAFPNVISKAPPWDTWEIAVPESIEFLLRHGYVVVFLFVLAEQLGLPLPAIPFLLAAGALSKAGRLDYTVVLLLAVSASLLSDGVWYLAGRRRGAVVLGWLCRISLEPDSCVRRTEQFFGQHGANALLAAKFVPGLSTAAPPLSGMMRMPPWKFLLLDGAGALVWAGAFTGLGWAFSHQLELAAVWAVKLGGVSLLLVSGVAGVYMAGKLLQRHRTIRELRIARITPEELKRMLDSGEEPTIVDLRHGVEAAARPETIPGALHLPAEELEHRHAEIPRGREVVLSCT